ncbi:MAG: Eco57I restriction-modification methylase domain-containing protein [Promethearchaeati archaeon]
MIYTPINIIEYIIRETISKYLKINFNLDLESSNKEKFFISLTRLTKDQNLRLSVRQKLRDIRILDPSCGSGRFLAITADFLYKIYKILFPNSKKSQLKRQIIENNLHGIDLEKDAVTITKLRLFLWFLKEQGEYSGILNKFDEDKIKDIDNLNSKLGEAKIKFNLFINDYLLDYLPKKKFDIIIGNPPYVENKKISDRFYKTQLYNTFKSAYKLFDLSILFLEKSLKILTSNSGIISFIITNKFLASNYGIKIRKILLEDTRILQIINISSLPVFSKHSAYPIIISLQNQPNNERHEILIEEYNTLKDLLKKEKKKSQKILQNQLLSLPEVIIPLKGNLNFINQIFSNFSSLEKAFPELNVIYRPYAFTNYKKYYKFANAIKISEQDLILLGTGNLGKYHFRFRKKIKIANHNLNVSYFHFPDNNSLNETLSSEKIIFREIAKDLTCVYDPGVFTNITGLYFIKIPSLNTNELFSLLSILNSQFLDTLFKNLYETLHMSGGYLRFNGSFIKKLPIPEYLPSSLGSIGKILQILIQYEYDSLESLSMQEVISPYILNQNITFLQSLCESLIQILYLSKLDYNIEKKFPELLRLLFSKNIFPDINFKFSKRYFDLPKFSVFSDTDILSIYSQIKSINKKLENNKILKNEINNLKNYNF